jgi:UDP-2,3-diacylglucosamine pyrophosphatase LpxH
LKKTLIFADVHLKVDPAKREALDEFVRFLRSIDPAEIERVIIVGDLFDFWFEYRHGVFSGYFECFDRSALRAVTISDPLPPLPDGFGGSELGVHFGFDWETQ